MKPLQGLYIIYVINNGRTDLMKCKESHPLRDAVGRGDRVKYHIQVLVFLAHFSQRVDGETRFNPADIGTYSLA